VNLNKRDGEKFEKTTERLKTVFFELDSRSSKEVFGRMAFFFLRITMASSNALVETHRHTESRFTPRDPAFAFEHSARRPLLLTSLRRRPPNRWYASEAQTNSVGRFAGVYDYGCDYGLQSLEQTELVSGKQRERGAYAAFFKGYKK
jgi:hypothetical protein